MAKSRRLLQRKEVVVDIEKNLEGARKNLMAAEE